MREIKFRAWDKLDKKMWHDVQNAYDGQFEHGDEDDYFAPESFGHVLGDENYVVMQFTGQHDRDGAEIYESDILEIRGKRYEVAWGEDILGSQFVLKDINLEEGRLWKNTMTDMPYSWLMGVDHSSHPYKVISKVVGNLCEKEKMND